MFDHDIVSPAKSQSVYRRYRGKIMRKALREEMVDAAIHIQRAAKRFLNRRLRLKNVAARVIQRNWRLKRYWTLMILSVIYRQPLIRLHRSATTIQRAVREYNKKQLARRRNDQGGKIQSIGASAITLNAVFQNMLGQLMLSVHGGNPSCGPCCVHACIIGGPRLLSHCSVIGVGIIYGHYFAKMYELACVRLVQVLWLIVTNCCELQLHLIFRVHGESV